MRPTLFAALILTFFSSSLPAQTPLQNEIRKIAAAADGKVSVSCSLPGSSLNCDLEPHAHPPMQSVFKLPLAVCALHQIEQGKFSLDQPIRFLPSDRFFPKTFSPLQDKYPDANVDVPLRELLRLAASLSDNVAADIVLRLIGGPAVVDACIKSLGVEGFHLEDGEHGLHRDPAAQYRNWFEPAGAVQFLRKLSDNSPLSPEHTELLLTWMKDSPTGPNRIKGALPAGTIVMHKTGSSGTQSGKTPVTNDIGLIVLPDGRRLALAVFVTDASAEPRHNRIRNRPHRRRRLRRRPALTSILAAMASLTACETKSLPGRCSVSTSLVSCVSEKRNNTVYYVEITSLIHIK